jgi:hypothetical protein
MFTVYVLLFTILYGMHCSMAREFVSYYTARPKLPFHWNLVHWLKDVHYLEK